MWKPKAEEQWRAGGKTRFLEGGYPPSGWIFHDVTDAKTTKNLFLSDIGIELSYFCIVSLEERDENRDVTENPSGGQIGFCRQKETNMAAPMTKMLTNMVICKRTRLQLKMIFIVCFVIIFLQHIQRIWLPTTKKNFVWNGTNSKQIYRWHFANSMKKTTSLM